MRQAEAYATNAVRRQIPGKPGGTTRFGSERSVNGFRLITDGSTLTLLAGRG
ncbi:MAG: hypothetical protein ANABAC_1502 [Anaerolineae bacterium]|nr:MAG: hypothetical protein ANABAC_1502 [Anaerolineae bacterium]